MGAFGVHFIFQMTIPPTLYHYTSIESLALILKTRKIRFSSLDSVNDLTEANSAEGQMLGQYVFISCWTAEEREELPLWSIYGKSNSGVRIELPSNWINKRKISIPDINKRVNDLGLQPLLKVENLESPIPIHELLNNNYQLANYGAEHHPTQVIYTDDEKDLTPKIFSPQGGNTRVDLGLLGNHKPTIWKFEREWRYKLQIFPFGITEISPENTDILLRRIHSGHPLNFKHYFIEISEEAFKKMGVKMGPKCCDAENTIVEALVAAYNPSCKIDKSSLSKRIR